MKALSRPLGILIAFAAITLTQATTHAASLATTYASGAGTHGEMFDVLATTPIRITAVQFAFFGAPLTDTVEIYTKTGTHVGSETTPGDWTLVFSGSVTVAAINVASPVVTLDTPAKLDSGQRLAFYIRHTSGNRVAYTTGDGTGTVEASDTNLAIFEGIGILNTFSATQFADRIPNVTIHYNTIKPFLRARKGITRIVTSKRRVVLRGSAGYATSIEYKVVGQGGYKKARGTLRRWKAPAKHNSRRTKVKLRAYNTHGRTVLKVILRKP